MWARRVIRSSRACAALCATLLLTLAGYWIGRYGETTGRDRGHAPFLAVAIL